MVGPARILNKRIVIETHKRRQPETGRAGVRRHVDLSHVIEDGLVTYPGLPAVQVCDYLSREQSREHYEAGTEFHIASIGMVANTGTYIDCPFHRYADGADLSQVERSEEHTSELQSLMRISYAVFCFKTKKQKSDSNNKGRETLALARQNTQ